MELDLYAEAGHVTCGEAREILSRFIASHFEGRMGAPTGEHARISIPANPRRDDDLRLEAFIQRVEKMERELDAVRAERDEARAEWSAASSHSDFLGRAFDVQTAVTMEAFELLKQARAELAELKKGAVQ